MLDVCPYSGPCLKTHNLRVKLLGLYSLLLVLLWPFGCKKGKTGISMPAVKVFQTPLRYQSMCSCP